MADFTIRSLQFKNANNLSFTNLEDMSFLGIDTESKEFNKIAVNEFIERKFHANLKTDGINFEFNNVEKYYQLSKDYTTLELTYLNNITTYLTNINKAMCGASNCSGTCAVMTMSATNIPGSCVNCSGMCVETCSGACESICKNTCGGSCSGSAAANMYG